MRFHGAFAYVEGHLTDSTTQQLCRLRYGGYANQWGFAAWLASSDRYEGSFLPTGSPAGASANGSEWVGTYGRLGGGVS